MNFFNVKRFVILDMLSMVLSIVAALIIGSDFNFNYLYHSLIFISFFVFLQFLSCKYMGLFRGSWQFSSIADAVRIIKSSLVGFLYLFVIFVFSKITTGHKVYLSSVILYPIFLACLLAFPRVVFRWLVDRARPRNQINKPVLIVGAGVGGERLIRDMLRGAQGELFPVAVVDDKYTGHNWDIHGVPVLGSCSDISKLVSDLSIEIIVIAIPSANSNEMNRIIGQCELSGVEYRTLPSVNMLINDEVNTKTLREVNIEDLLFRKPFKSDYSQKFSIFSDKTILITGAGGSIGGELTLKLAVLGVKKLILVDNSEFALYSIQQKLELLDLKCEAVLSLASVVSYSDMEELFVKIKPDIIFHAAAFKHVPLLESQIFLAVSNNVIGTKNISQLAIKYNVKKVILISTDKAVHPTNIMGATKRAAERLCQNMGAKSLTEFITVRFGNVLGSRGSVIPLFQSQIKQGGPVTLTHPDITRYFMTISEAATLILEAAYVGKSGEIYVLDMGAPIKILDLAKELIRLSNKSEGQIQIQYTGLRPGEKMFEELFYDFESPQKTSSPKILRASHQKFPIQSFDESFQMLEKALVEKNRDLLFKSIILMLPEIADIFFDACRGEAICDH